MKRWPLFAAIVYVVLLFAGLLAVPAAPEVTGRQQSSVDTRGIEYYPGMKYP